MNRLVFPVQRSSGEVLCLTPLYQGGMVVQTKRNSCQLENVEK